MKLLEIKKNRWIIVVVAALTIAFCLLEHPPERSESDSSNNSTTACMTATMTNYTKSKMSVLKDIINTESKGGNTIQAIITERRLEENYCNEFAKCSLLASHKGFDDLILSTNFSSCLEDEAKEKYNLSTNDQ